MLNGHGRYQGPGHHEQGTVQRHQQMCETCLAFSKVSHRQPYGDSWVVGIC
jgi:hypothetical protein